MRKLNFVNYLRPADNHEILCETKDNGVVLIKKLGSKIDVDPKQLCLYNNGEQLDPNKLIENSIVNIYYQNLESNVTDIFVKIKKNYFDVPKYIQIARNAKIKDFKNILSNLKHDDKLSIFLFKENGEMLLDSSTLDSCNITDESKISIWMGENLLVTLNICNPLIKISDLIKTQVIQTVKFVMTDSISDINRRISEIMRIDNGKLFLFTDSSCLQHNKRLIDYPIKDNDCIYGVNLIKKENIDIESKPFKKGKYAKIFEGKFGNPPKKIAVSKFKLDKKDINEKKILKYEIITRIKLSCTLLKRFVPLIEMYEEGDFFFIAMDYIEESLKSRYNSRAFHVNDIIHYSSQISDGLGYMHNNFILHRNLKCSSVLIDRKNNVKLCNFYFSKFLYNNTTSQILLGIPGSKIEDSKCWLSPEILAGEPYGLKSDIWSLGATMIEMLTRNRPYADMQILQAVAKIVENRTIDYNRTISPECSEIIDQCISAIQDNRPTCEQVKSLLEDIS